MTLPPLQAPHSVKSDQRKLQMYHLNVEDMTCGHCVGAVEHAVKAVDPNAKVAVDLEAKTASIDSEVGSDVFIAAIEEAGYRASFKKSCCSHVA